jgi:hypothetical protein
MYVYRTHIRFIQSWNLMQFGNIGVPSSSAVWTMQRRTGRAEIPDEGEATEAVSVADK